ncbi:hypothetical protein M0802_006617 [Mischocyttarus mexicanus]|nr:hypothetical protein M0802_006617 [Mischocyttarus mexicanus]
MEDSPRYEDPGMYKNRSPYSLRRLGDMVPARVVLYMLSFSGFLVSFMMRTDINLAMVAMAKPTTSNDTVTETSHYCYKSTNVSHVEYNNNNNTNNTGSNFVRLEEEGEFDWSPAIQSAILGSFYWCYILSQVVGGVLTQYFGTKTVFGGSQLLTAICSLLMPSAAEIHYGAMIALRSIQGIASGLTWPAMYAIVGHWIPPVERSRFMSSFQVSILTTEVYGKKSKSEVDEVTNENQNLEKQNKRETIKSESNKKETLGKDERGHLQDENKSKGKKKHLSSSSEMNPEMSHSVRPKDSKKSRKPQQNSIRIDDNKKQKKREEDLEMHNVIGNRLRHGKGKNKNKGVNVNVNRNKNHNRNRNRKQNKRQKRDLKNQGNEMKDDIESDNYEDDGGDWKNSHLDVVIENNKLRKRYKQRKGVEDQIDLTIDNKSNSYRKKNNKRKKENVENVISGSNHDDNVDEEKEMEKVIEKVEEEEEVNVEQVEEVIETGKIKKNKKKSKRSLDNKLDKKPRKKIFSNEEEEEEEDNYENDYKEEKKVSLLENVIEEESCKKKMKKVNYEEEYDDEQVEDI